MTKKYLCGVVSAAVLMGACPTARGCSGYGRRLGLGCKQPNADR